MKQITISLSILLLSGLASAEEAKSPKVPYGKDLCYVASSIKSTKANCETWVKKNPDLNVYSMALGLCERFSDSAEKKSTCFSHATSWIYNKDTKASADDCLLSHDDEKLVAECLVDLFTIGELQTSS